MDQFKYKRMTLEAELALAETSVLQAQASLDARAESMQPLLPLIERLSLFPAETLLAIPARPEETLRGVLVLRAKTTTPATQEPAVTAAAAPAPPPPPTATDLAGGPASASLTPLPTPSASASASAAPTVTANGANTNRPPVNPGGTGTKPSTLGGIPLH